MTAAAASRAALPAAVALLGALAERPEPALLAALFAALALGPVVAGRGVAPLAALGLAAAVLVAAGVVHADVPRPLPAAALVAGLLLLGAGCARLAPRAARVGAPVVVGTAALLCGAPDLFGAAPAHWARHDPGLAARLLDLSPATWVEESAGLDWMRHPSVYAPAGTDWYSDARRPFDGLALGVAALVVGASTVVLTGRRAQVPPREER